MAGIVVSHTNSKVVIALNTEPNVEIRLTPTQAATLVGEILHEIYEIAP